MVPNYCVCKNYKKRFINNHYDPFTISRFLHDHLDEYHT